MQDNDPVVRLAVIEEWRKHVDHRFDTLEQKIDGLSSSFPWGKFGAGLGALVVGVVSAVKF